MQDKVKYILVRNLGKCEEWDSFIVPELLQQFDIRVIDLPKLREDTATEIYKNTLSFTEARCYKGFSTAQLAGLRAYLRRAYDVLVKLSLIMCTAIE